MDSSAFDSRGTKQPLTIGDYAAFLAPDAWVSGQPPLWPPDAFAIVASILQKSGAYPRVVTTWPPHEYDDRPREWMTKIKRIGIEWRQRCVSGQPVPSEVGSWWNILRDRQGLPIFDIHLDPDLCCALLQICAAADEASAGAGIPHERTNDAFETQAGLFLAPLPKIGSTLCNDIPSSKVRVLPKLHTPQSGMTIRSLTHHLALCPAQDVEALWYITPNGEALHSLNLLLFPWPKSVLPVDFRKASPPQGKLANMAPKYCFFDYSPSRSNPSLCSQVMEILDKAKEESGEIQGIVFPELSLTAKQREDLRTAAFKRGAFLICGVSEASPSPGEPGRNYVTLDIPVATGGDPASGWEVSQNKHHRWLLNETQIKQYGLGAQLDPNKLWWEHIPIGERNLAFVAMRPWLTLCTLICEDLARQDPVGELIRAVGPNLVIALLMDGPQLNKRWPSRYATVLADDPGSSVLTLTSVGMAELSAVAGESRSRGSRVIALWKDALSGVAEEISLPPGKEAVVLNITVKKVEEWSADGRSDGGVTGYPVKSGLHFV